MTIDTVILIKRLINQGRLKVDLLTGEVMTKAGKSSFDLIEDPDQHLSFNLSVDGRRRKIFVHDIIAIAGELNATNKTIYHVNGNKHDNRLYNLTTEKPTEIPQADQTNFNTRRMEKPTSKLTEAHVKDIKKELSQGATLRTLAIKYGVSTSTIYRIKHGERWAHVKASKGKPKKAPEAWQVHWQN